MNNKIKVLFTVLMSFLTMSMEGTAQAYKDYIDEFSVTRDGIVIFDDNFNSGNPPPNAPNFTGGAPASYFVVGTMGPELNTAPNPGKLELNSSGALPTTTAAGVPVLNQTAFLVTNYDPANLTSGLKSNFTFSVTGVFDLIRPSVPGERYFITLGDQLPGRPNINDIVQLGVVNDPSNNSMIELISANTVTHTVTIIDQSPLEMGHDQIAFTLARESVSSNAVAGSFYYIDGGTKGSVSSFTPTVDIFHGENWTIASFSAATPVPEPTSMLLLISGLIGLWGFRRKVT